MTATSFDYEDVCMGARGSKPVSYKLSFHDDYRLRSLTGSVTLGKGTLLDIGCGGGRISESLPYYYPNGKIFGCDISKSAISYAKKYGSGKVTYVHSKGKMLPFADRYFDVCICLDVLEHVPDVSYFLKEVQRVLKKHGTLFLIVPCEGQPFTYTWLFQKLHIGQDLTFRYFGHIHPEFTHKSVLVLLKEQGFVIRHVRYSEHLMYQWLHVCIFFLPKILLEAFVGRRIAHEYTNSSLLHSPKRGLHPLLIVRKIWFIFFNFLMMHPMSWETIIMKDIPFSAWKLHVAAIKGK